MKTPQEIASEIFPLEQDGLKMFIDLNERRDFIAIALAAAREEGRREGIEQAAKVVVESSKFEGSAERHVVARACLNEAARMIRALASQPKPKPERALTGEAAREFLAEMKRIENLPRDSEEYRERAAFLDECRRIYEASKPEPAVTCEGCKRGLPFATDATLIHGRLPHVEVVNNGFSNFYTPCTAADAGKAGT